MSSLSGDEAENVKKEPVRRTRSGRTTRKVAATLATTATTAISSAKKGPVKKVVTRSSRSPRKAQEVEEVEDEPTAIEDDSQETAANGVQAAEQQDEEVILEFQPEETEDIKPDQEIEEKQEEIQEKNRESNQKTKQEGNVKAKQEANQKAKQEANQKAKQEASQKARQEASQKAKQEASQKAKQEASQKAKQETNQKTKQDSQKTIPELESPPPPVVTNVQTGTAIHSTLKVKESSQHEDEAIETMEEDSKDAEVVKNVMEIMELTEAVEESIPTEIVETIAIEDSEPSSMMEVDEEVQRDELGIDILEIPDSETVILREECSVVEAIEPDMVVEHDIDEKELLAKAAEEIAEMIEKKANMEFEIKAISKSETVPKTEIAPEAEVPETDLPETEVELEAKSKSEVERTLKTQVVKSTEDVEMVSASDVEKEIEPDTEAVSEDELPTEAASKEPETEAVSDEELPTTAAADLGETESVSEDELPPDSEKKKKGLKKVAEKKSKSEGTNKRKLNADGEYDPSSPTSENNDETPAKKVALTTDTESDAKQDTKPASPKKKTLPELEKYWKAVNEDPSDFTGWTYLLQYVDQENDAEAAREAYSKFLERYPYCYGYWRKYADYEKKKGDPENVQKVFDAGLKAISLSVDLWLHYINHCKVVYEKDEKKMREQYERAIAACGLEFRSDRLWESYIKWETEGKRLNKVTAIYDRLLTTPTLGYISHFDAFQEFVSSNAPNQILSVDDFLSLRSEVKTLLKAEDVVPATSADTPPGEEPPPHEVPPSDEETRAIREKIISSRRKMHKANVIAVAARWNFEEGIKRPYFHVKPLERCQLKNWKEYLDFEINEKDSNRIVILFERCLIACALYDEFWMRFIRYLESVKTDNTEKIRDVYTRACTVHHPKKPNLHLQWATFEESHGNFEKAAEILENIDNALPNMLQVAYRRINLERRRGDLEKACTLYENYIANSKNRITANNIAVKYARFLCKIKNDVDKAVKTLLKATEKDKDNPRLYLQLIDLGLQRNPVDPQEIVGYMDMFIDREHADLKQRLLFAQRKVEFLEDFSPDIQKILKAYEQFQKCIKQTKERKKTKNEDSKTDLSPPEKLKSGDQSSAPPPPSISSQSSYQYSSGPSGPYQSQQQFQGSHYGSQSGYQQGYQQYPPPSDPNYANYQNWQYGQSGPQAYGPYNQWGSYNYY